MMAALMHFRQRQTLRSLPIDHTDRLNRRGVLTAAFAHNSNAKIPFFTLSPELRSVIYSLALPETKVLSNRGERLIKHQDRGNAHAPSHLEPALLRTHEFFRQEARQMYYATVKYRYQSGRCNQRTPYLRLEQWLHSLGDCLQFSRNVITRQGYP